LRANKKSALRLLARLVNGAIVKLDGDFLFVSGADEADLPVLITYRIAEPIGAPTDLHSAWTAFSQ